MGAAERRAEILRVLCRRKYETISNLAEEFGVSKRTIQRDVVALSITEPIYTQCGRYGGGVYVMKNHSMEKTYLTDSEYAVLHKVLMFAKTKSVCELEEKEIVILEKYISQHTKPKLERKYNDESKRRKLFKSLCSFKKETFDESLLEAATPVVLGHLFFNRMQAVAYGTLKKHGLLGKVNREFRNSLKNAYMQNKEKNESFFYCVEYLEKVLGQVDCPYAMLKGAYLCRAYPEGYRTSNDIDLLVHPRDVTEIGKVLLEAGFKQGNVRNGKFEPATRKEIIESRMMRGETVPYIKEVNMPWMQFLEVDINFSLDYKPGKIDVLKEFLEYSLVEVLPGYHVKTLRKDDFFVHLCAHLYKEATTLPWVEMMRDMALYKYCDIYMIIDEAMMEYVDFYFKRAAEFHMEKICAFAVLQMSELFDVKNTYAVEIAQGILKNEPDFIHKVISPKEKKEYVYTEKDIENRFFSECRKTLLQEVTT